MPWGCPRSGVADLPGPAARAGAYHLPGRWPPQRRGRPACQRPVARAAAGAADWLAEAVAGEGRRGGGGWERDMAVPQRSARRPALPRPVPARPYQSFFIQVSAVCRASPR